MRTAARVPETWELTGDDAREALVALQIWTFVSALRILYGAAVAAQLEAIRAGIPAPARDREPATASASPMGKTG